MNSRFSWSETDKGGFGGDFFLGRLLCLPGAGVAFGPIVVVVDEEMGNPEKYTAFSRPLPPSLPHGRGLKIEADRLRWRCRRRCRRGRAYGRFLNVWYRTFYTCYTSGLTRDPHRGHHRSPAAHHTDKSFTTSKYAWLPPVSLHRPR